METQEQGGVLVTTRLLAEEDQDGERRYLGAPGTRYQIADGYVVTFAEITKGRSEEFWRAYKRLGGGTRTITDGCDIVLGKIASEGEWPDDEDLLYARVVGALAEDFGLASRQISRPETPLSRALTQLTTGLDLLGMSQDMPDLIAEEGKRDGATERETS